MTRHSFKPRCLENAQKTPTLVCKICGRWANDPLHKIDDDE
jgi:hypothetical protein